MRKISKRAILILAIFALSVIPVMPAYAAVPTIDSVTQTDGDPLVAADHDYGSHIAVIGSNVRPGGDVNVYWDYLNAWDGEDGLLNSTDADMDGDYEIWFDVPKTVYGHHVIHIEDDYSGDYNSSDFDVYPKVTVSPDTGLAGDDDISVKGYGFHGGNEVVILFNSSRVNFTTEIELDELEGEGDEDTFDGELANTPIGPDSVTFYNGTVAQDITDNGEGKLEGLNVSSGKINYVSGEWEIVFDYDLPASYEFDVEYDTPEETARMEVLAGSDETDDVGSFSKTVSIPDNFGIARYDMYVFDGKGVSALDRFDLGPVIELVPNKGPVGAVIKVKGRGFSGGEYITSITLGGIDCYNTSEVRTNSRGAFTISFVVPSVSDDDEKYDVVVTDGTVDAEEEFKVLGLPEIELTPSYGGPDDIVEIHGWNFTQISGTDVEVNFTNGVDTYVDTYETNGEGEISGSLMVPPEESGKDYTVYASTVDHMINATTTFRMGFVFVRMRPLSGEEGTRVSIDGTGFTDDDEWNATLDGEDVIDDGTVDGTGGIYDTFYIPNMGTGTYDLTILDVDSGIKIHIDLTVTEETYLELYPPSAANEFNITITGRHFSDDETADLEFDLYNTTADGEIDFSWDISNEVYIYDEDEDEPYTGVDIELDDNGNFTGYWKVFEDDEISLGTYWLNVTDDNELFAQIQVDVIDPDVEITSRKTAYEIDDTLAFTMLSTFSYSDSYIEVYDPNDDLYWVTDDLDTWLKVGLLQVVPYYSQTSGQNPMVFTSDAPQGTWTWTWYDSDDDEIESGTFTLGPSSTAILTEQMTGLTGDVTALSETVGGLSTTVGDLSSTVSDISEAVSDTAAAVNSVTSSVSDLADVVGDIANEASNAKTAADNAKSAADAAKDAADDAKTAASGLSTLVYGAIGASLVAAFAAIFSLMQINKKIAG